MSTTTIDHAIAIAAPQSVVWAQISDLSKNPRWQANCESVSYLTTMHSGRGTRWRMHTRRGVEYVLEITAWYDRLGYEYVIVDGAPYANSRGRLRLQEAPEGTVVQWTFNYEMKGLLSGLRNSLNVRRSLDREIIESLQNLYTYIKELSPEEAFTPESTKSLIQEAPDVMQRANYQPRHPSALDRMKAATLEIRALDDEEEAFEGVSVRRSNSGNSPSIFEPPVEDDDTRPNPAIAEPADEQLAEPDFLQDASFTAKEPDESLRLPLLDDEEVLEESTEAAPTLPSLDDEMEETSDRPLSGTLSEPLPDIPGKRSTLDTAEISVFEVFGLQRPSETGRMRAVQEADQTTSRDTTRIIPDVTPREAPRQGLRATLRRQIIKLRTPSA